MTKVLAVGRRTTTALLLVLTVILIANLPIVFFSEDMLASPPRAYMFNLEMFQERNVELNMGLYPERLKSYFSMLAGGTLGKTVEGRLITNDLIKYLPTTYTIVGLAMLISITLGLALGFVGSVFLRHLRGVGPIYMALTTVTVSAPEFVLLALLRVFLVKAYSNWGIDFGHLYYPVLGNVKLGDHLIPLISISIVAVAYVARISTGFFDSVGPQDYIRTAKSKGVRPFRIVSGHALKNVFVDILDAVPGVFGLLIASMMVIEHLYGYPGVVGRFIHHAHRFSLDYVTAVALVVTVTYLLLDGVTSAMQGWLDPRRREVQVRGGAV